MAWFTANWFQVLILIAFVAMHLFGHGGHGGRGRADPPGGEGSKDKEDAPRGHQH